MPPKRFEFRKGDAFNIVVVDYHTEDETMHPIAHPGRLLKREFVARNLSANRLALVLGVPSGRITDILNGRRSITAETAMRLGRYFGDRPSFWLDLQSQYDVALVERDRGTEIANQVRSAGASGVTRPDL